MTKKARANKILFNRILELEARQRAGVQTEHLAYSVEAVLGAIIDALPESQTTQPPSPSDPNLLVSPDGKRTTYVPQCGTLRSNLLSEGWRPAHAIIDALPEPATIQQAVCAITPCSHLAVTGSRYCEYHQEFHVGPEPKDARTAEPTSTWTEYETRAEIEPNIASYGRIALRPARGPQEPPNVASGATQEPKLNGPDVGCLMCSDICPDCPVAARKLRIMKAMEDIAKKGYGSAFVFEQDTWCLKSLFGYQKINDMYCTNENGVPEKVAEEPLWEGELWTHKEALASQVIPGNDESHMEKYGWRKIKVREVRP